MPLPNPAPPPGEPRPRAGRLWAPLALILSIPVALLTLLRVTIIDDAYISYRYAANLAAGKGLVFNGGERVEGATNLLWTLLLAPASALGLGVEAVAALAGVALGLAAVAGAWGICARLGVPSRLAALALLVVACYPGFWLVMANGLEAGLFALLLVQTVFLIVAGRPLFLAGLTGGLLFLTRPESVVVVPICAAYLLWAERGSGRDVRGALSRLLPLLAPWFAVVAGATAWRLLYYGALVPNSITAKSLGSFDLRQVLINLAGGTLYLLQFLLSAAPLTLGAALALWLAPRRRYLLLLALLILAQVVAILGNGGDWMPHYRLLAPYVPLLAILAALGLQEAVERGIVPTPLRRPAPAALALLAVVVLMASLPGYPWRTRPAVALAPSEVCYERLARSIGPALLPTDRISPEALGYFSFVFRDNYSHDMLGLTDRHIARYGTLYIRRFGKADPAYTYSEARPDLIVVHSGLRFLRAMDSAAGGQYDEEYLTYDLAGQGCPDKALVVSIRAEYAPRFASALAAIHARPILVRNE